MESEIPMNQTTALLTTKTRRQVVTLLLEVERPFSVEDLAAELVRLDPTVSPDDTDTESQAEQLAIRLYHQALPKLADAGVVDFDTEEAIITPGQHLHAIGSYLDDWLDLPNKEMMESATSVHAD